MNELSGTRISESRTAVIDAVDSARRALTSLLEQVEQDGANDPATAAAIASTQEVLDRLAPRSAGGNAFAASARGGDLVFDVSDLLAYFPYNRAPTGIQRVQMEVIASFIEGGTGPRPRLCRFLKETDRWSEVSGELFLGLCAASKSGSDALAKDWIATYDRLDAASRSGEIMPFAPGMILVNLGSSWWLPNYFLQIRHLKKTANIRYVPLIYDMIPAIAPQFCMPELVSGFNAWLVGVLDHADYFLAISEATKRDLIDLAKRAGHEIAPDQIGVVPLDADFRSGAKSGSPPPRMVSGKYVLFVSTLELRKNQLGAIDAWRALINEYGAENVPQLVLVGKNGFLGNKVRERLQADEVLKKRVTLLSGVDDEQLAGLYRHCLFTLYPSNYEGWGLPVTESLCYGKVPLIADGSSLPEAGGGFAVYFAAGSGSELLGKLRKLISDEPYRKRLEQKIAKDFRPRAWTDIGAQIASLVRGWAERTDQPAEILPPLARRGFYYELSAGTSRTLWSGMGSAEMFRQGLYWWELEPWGSWSKPAGGGLQMRIAGDGPARLALELRGLPDKDCDVEIRSGGGDLLAGGVLHGDSVKWLLVDVPAGQEEVDIRIIGSEVGIDPDPENDRKLGVGLKGFFIIDQVDPDARARFYEAVALGNLHDLSFFRRRIET